jgi:magnesium chelatase subunit ChlI-like protein
MLGAFARLFSKRLWEHAKILLMDAILSPAERTVTAVLRVMGLRGEKHFQNYSGSAPTLETVMPFFRFSSLAKNTSDCVHPCLCGNFGDPQKAYACAPAVVTKYQKRISGPLLDRIDIHIEVPRVDYEKLSGNRIGGTSETIRKRVQAARNIQQQRFASLQSNITYNADLRVGEIRQFCKLQNAGGDDAT